MIAHRDHLCPAAVNRFSLHARLVELSWQAQESTRFLIPDGFPGILIALLSCFVYKLE